MATKVTVKNHGSIRVEGEFELFDQDGNRFDLAGRTLIKLCRCGFTRDAPFCDSTHKKVNFQSEIVARSLPPPQPKA